MNNNKFKDVLFDLLIENDLSLRKLSQELNVDDSTFYDYKNHDAVPDLKTAIKIANYFNCSLNYLVGIDDNLNIKFKHDYDISLFVPRYLKLLQDNSITHHRLCKETGVNESSLWVWKKGAIPKLETLIKIANYFGVSIDYLVGRAD